MGQRDGGGGVALSIGAGYRLSGAAGQPDAGALVGAGYTLLGRFWRSGEASPPAYEICLPLVLQRFP